MRSTGRCPSPTLALASSAVVLGLLGGCARPVAPPPDDPSELVNYLEFDEPPGEAPVISLQAARWLKARLRPGPPRLLKQLDAEAKGAEALREEAEMILHHGWRLRDNPVVRHDQPIDWHVSPRNDRNWHYKLNALLFLEPVLLAYVLTGHQRYYDVTLAVLLDWIDQNMPAPERLPDPAPEGDAGVDEDAVDQVPPPPLEGRELPKSEMRWYDMANANRSLLINFFLQHELARDIPDTRLLATLVRAADEHVYRRLKGARIVTNHGMYSAVGIRAAVIDLHGLPRRVEAMEESREWMKTSLEAQFSERMMHLEDTPIYQLNIVSAVRGIKQLDLFDDLPLVGDIAREGWALIPWLFHPNGELVQVGDGSQRPLIGPEAAVTFLTSDGQQGPPPPPLSSWIFNDAGVTIYRSPWSQRPPSRHSYLYVLAANHKSGHSHADFGTFEWSDRGEPIIVNSGGYSYQHNSWRRYFKATRAGSTVEVDNVAYPTKPKGRRGFSGVGLKAWGRVAPDTPWVAAQFTHRVRKLDHARTLLMKDDGWLLVIDDVRASSGSKPRSFKQWFHFHEAIDDVQEVPQGVSVALPSGRRVTMVALDAALASPVEIARGRVQGGIQGWISREYLEKVPRIAAALGQTGTRATFATLLSVGDGAIEQTEARWERDTLSVRWRAGDQEEVWRFERRDGLWRPAP